MDRDGVSADGDALWDRSQRGVLATQNFSMLRAVGSPCFKYTEQPCRGCVSPRKIVVWLRKEKC